MTKLIRPPALFALIVLMLASCNINTTPAPNPLLPVQATAGQPQLTTIELTAQADPSTPFSELGQVIKFNFNIRNTGTASTPGPVIITGMAVTCPEINTIGNKDAALDVNETLVCTSPYTITQADFDKGSVTIIATAAVNGINSNQVTTAVQAAALRLAKTADSATYDHIGQAITYTYVITNISKATLGPAQFTVTDTGVGSAPLNCGEATVTLASNATVTCSASHIITQADMDSASISTSATASGGAGSSQTVSVTITKTPLASNLTTGATINHQVANGEWLWQIARCYGADPKAVSNANPPTPAEISPNTTVTVPNIGSAGKIYGPPCIESHTVKSGDTWNSIALRYNADSTVLQMVNKNTLAVGNVLKVPLNSTGGPQQPAGDLIRINFAAGSTTATQTGIALSGNRLVRYVLAANQGQVLTVKITAPANSVNMAIYAPDGSTLKAYDFNPAWTGTLPANGDYRIDIANALGLGAVSDVSFTLEVSITNP